MALPDVFNTRGVYDDFIDLLGRPALGEARFASHVTRWTTLDGPSILAVDIVVPIITTQTIFVRPDGSEQTLTTGRFSVDLPLSVDPDIVQEDTYTVTLSLIDGDGKLRRQDPYDIKLVAGDGQPVRLRNLAPAGPVDPTVAYLTDAMLLEAVSGKADIGTVQAIEGRVSVLEDGGDGLTLEQADAVYQRLSIGVDADTGEAYFDPAGADAGEVAAVVIEDGLPAVVAPGSDSRMVLETEPHARATSDALQAEVDAKVPLPAAARNPLTGKFHLDGFGVDRTGATDCTAAYQAAVDAAVAVGGVVYVPAGTYKHGRIDLSNTAGLGIEYAPHGQATTVPVGSATIDHLFGNTGAVKSLDIDGLAVRGAVVDDVTGPRRGRTYIGAQINAALIINGDRVPGGGYPVASDVRITRARIRGTSSLPILLRGVRGVASIQDSLFELTMDVGWTFCERVVCTGNTSLKSADNGFSMSRGNSNVTCSNNYVSDCAYNAYFAAGFLSDKGPQHITITGNVARSTGNSGIYLDMAAKHATITGNDLDGGYYRGGSDGPTDALCTGIFLGGYPDTARSAPTDWGEGIVVSGNHVRGYPRAGIFGTGLRRVLIVGNKIDDIGTQYLADGTTPISAADQTQNVAVLIDNATTSSDVYVANNHCTDGRTTPYMNYSIVPVGSSAVQSSYNTMVGARNAYNLSETGPTRNITYGMVFSQNTKHTAGGTAGSTAGTGAIAGFDINGAVGSVRRHKIQTAGSDRWQYGADGTAESGSSAGTDFVVNAYDDAGAFLATLLRLTRKQAVTLGVQGQPVTIAGRIVSGAAAATVTPGAQSSAASAASNGANDTAGTVNATAGPAPGAGTVVVVAFATAYTSVPHVSITATNLATAQARPYLSARSATGFTVSCEVPPAPGAALQLDYIVAG